LTEKIVDEKSFFQGEAFPEKIRVEGFTPRSVLEMAYIKSISFPNVKQLSLQVFDYSQLALHNEHKALA
jgi:hypothetical protein